MGVKGRLDAGERLAQLVDERLDASPPVSIRTAFRIRNPVFLAAYRRSKDGELQDTSEVWQDLSRRKGLHLDPALHELTQIQWLTSTEAPDRFERTEIGSQAHSAVRQFAYGRLG